ncbi:MAG: hypothetical protein DMF85_11355 [Acidobacteria bacterium]|nr:MAG: hypothetical protein DMF85_11355 [Acidobacteriota bacterium]
MTAVGAVLALLVLTPLSFLLYSKNRTLDSQQRSLVDVTQMLRHRTADLQEQRDRQAETNRQLAAAGKAKDAALAEANRRAVEIARLKQQVETQKDTQLRDQWSLFSSRDLANASRFERMRQPGFITGSLLLSIEAAGRSPSAPAYTALVEAMQLAAPRVGTSHPWQIQTGSVGAALSGSRRYIAMWNAAEGLCVHNTDTPGTVACVPLNDASRGAVDDNGNVVVQAGDGHLQCVPRGREPVPCAGAPDAIAKPIFSTDGKYVGWLSGTGSNQLHILDLATGSPTDVSDLSALLPREQETGSPDSLTRSSAPGETAAADDSPELLQVGDGGRYALLAARDSIWIYRVGSDTIGRAPDATALLVSSPDTGESLLATPRGLWSLTAAAKGLALAKSPTTAFEDRAGIGRYDANDPWLPIAFSPDGRFVGYETSRGLTILNRATGESHPIALDASAAARPRFYFAVGPEGSLAVTVGEQRAIRIYDAKGHERARIVPPNAKNAAVPLRLTDRKVIALTDTDYSEWATAGYRGVVHDTSGAARFAVSSTPIGTVQIVSAVTMATPLSLPTRSLRLRSLDDGRELGKWPVAEDTTFKASASAATIAFQPVFGQVDVLHRAAPSQPFARFTLPDARKVGAVSPDGRWVAALRPCGQSPDGCLSIYDLDGDRLPRGEFPVDPASIVAFSAGRDRRPVLAIVSDGGRFASFDLTGAVVHASTLNVAIKDGVFSADGSTFLATAGTGASQALLFWDIGAAPRTLPFTEPIEALALSRAGDAAAIRTPTAVVMFRTRDLYRIRSYSLSTPRPGASNIMFDGGGDLVIVEGLRVSVLRVANISKPNLITVAVKDQSTFRSTLVGVADVDGRVFTIDDGSLVVTGGPSTRGSPRAVIPSGVQYAQLANGGSVIVSLEGISGPVYWLPRTLSLVDPLHPAADRIVERPTQITAVATASSRGLVAVGEVSGAIVLVQAGSPGAPWREFLDDGVIRTLAFTPQGDAVASATNRTVTVRSVVDGAAKAQTMSQTDVVSVVFVDAGRLAVGAPDGTIRVFRMPGMTEVQRWKASPDLHSLIVSKDGLLLAAVGRWGAQIYRTADWRPVGDAERGKFEFALFAPTGSELALFEGNSVHVVAGRTGTDRYTLRHDTAVQTGAFSPDGRFLAVGTEEGVELWRLDATDPSSGRRLVHSQVGRFPVTDTIGAVAFTPDGGQLMIVLANGEIEVTPWRRDDLIKVACRQVPAGTGYGDNALDKFSPDGFRDFCRNPILAERH